MTAITARQWFATPLGQYVVEHEFLYFDQAVANIFGYNAMQLGMPYFDFLRMNRMPLRFTAGTECDNEMKAASDHLPIAGDTIDLVIVPHVLEFNKNPHQILREVYRVLIPEGHVVISGFNPISLWGVHNFFVSEREEFPWNGDFIALPRLKDWLKLFNFEMKGGKLCCYTPPFKQDNWRQRFRFMEDAGDRWWPISGGVYFLHAVKHKYGMRVIKPSWKSSLAGKKKIAAATQRIKQRNS
ncbi:Methyltransferase domain-containing protein [Nitrosomonas marina]|uniref:Methyltransferase domain-containing protein n=1 Tax=Nitrosomonas marina TaxID=917 RepID=A0A1H9ZFN8_9PROT|nr:methyltransferase domain-containing protein [Nitrosomonas marina]SES80415.1 Methyltransferase domain-containing protein [Nitrosomonas marina]